MSSNCEVLDRELCCNSILSQIVLGCVQELQSSIYKLINLDAVLDAEGRDSRHAREVESIGIRDAIGV